MNMTVCVCESVKFALGTNRKFAMHDFHLGLLKFSLVILFKLLIQGQCDPVNVHDLSKYSLTYILVQMSFCNSVLCINRIDYTHRQCTTTTFFTVMSV